jgi:DNA-binding winged helix-turn-helix (wHTH) protein
VLSVPTPPPVRRYRFGAFEADAATGELRRSGVRVKLNAQPFQVLCLLLARPGELLTRDEIARELWPDGTFVDYEHGVNSAINRIREALGDTAANPRFLETLARRGYRFLAPVEVIADATSPVTSSRALSERERQSDGEGPAPALAAHQTATGNLQPGTPVTLLATRDDLPPTPHQTVQTLFVLLQLMYLAFYIGALANLAEIEELLSTLPAAGHIFMVLIVTAGVLIPVRAFVLCATLFHAPRTSEKFLKLWPLLLLPLDELWSLSPFLLLHHINFGLALACTALLVYSPFAQRALILMGAGDSDRAVSPPV